VTRPDAASTDLLEREGCLERLLAAWSDALSRSGRAFYAYVLAAWAKQWPAEEIWGARKVQ
jgi:hypothetical protein